MPTLRLEDHLFRLLENRLTLDDYLQRLAHVWEWRVDLAGGEFLFQEKGTGRILLSSPTRRIGAYYPGERTFVWSWNDPQVPETCGATRQLDRLRVAAREEELRELDQAQPLALRSSDEALSWVLRCTGFLGAFTYYEALGTDIVTYYTIDSYPESGFATNNPQRMLAVLEEGSQRFFVKGRAAVEAYLGTPLRSEGWTLYDETLIFKLASEAVRITFDKMGQLQQIHNPFGNPDLAGLDPQANLPESEPAPPAARVGFLQRLLGKK